MLLLGIDVGTSSIKASVVDSATQKTVASAQYPETESKITSLQPGWAEQSPEIWWEHVQQAILKVNATGKYQPEDIGAIGIAYQMHGLVVVDKDQQVLRDSIIWCDSRAVPYGNKAFDAIGAEKSLSHLLNSPGNFTAAKLAWVKDNEPETYHKIHKIMLPGDFIAMKLTGSITTSASALSEGIFWDFQNDEVSQDVLNYFGFSLDLIPEVRPLFSSHGEVTSDVAQKLNLKTGIPVAYKSGDQPNNALSLNVLNPGEVAATAGTSGVIYGVSDQLVYDQQSRVNTFAHVNYTPDAKRVGVLMNINGTGIMNSWVKENLTHNVSYPEMNEQASTVAVGSNGLRIFPFGNGAERVFNNRIIGAQFHGLNFNLHTKAHIFRAVQEGIAFTFRYGLDIMRENGMNPQVIRAGKANMFLSELFAEAFVNATNAPVELYQNDGSVGAALGAGIGAGTFASATEAFQQFERLRLIEPTNVNQYEEAYQEWKSLLSTSLNN
ncbi:xylulokinase [Rufibacter roseus]|uniref:Xylulokinase n=1 Tax=Rufibacter roseus TaxID=1567108 RepID=A0ABW2DN60_9BACT|nr:FGGY family carbohydrate kinase [Rufibacter roseus]